jgi:hypothetical protein
MDKLQSQKMETRGKMSKLMMKKAITYLAKEQKAEIEAYVWNP